MLARAITLVQGVFVLRLRIAIGSSVLGGFAVGAAMPQVAPEVAGAIGGVALVAFHLRKIF